MPTQRFPINTAKIAKYRGHNIYIRNFSNEWWVVEVPFHGEIFNSVHEAPKKIGGKYKLYDEKETENLVAQLFDVGRQMVDELRRQRNPLFEPIIYKVEQKIKNIKLYAKSKTSGGSKGQEPEASSVRG